MKWIRPQADFWHETGINSSWCLDDVDLGPGWSGRDVEIFLKIKIHKISLKTIKISKVGTISTILEYLFESCKILGMVWNTSRCNIIQFNFFYIFNKLDGFRIAIFSRKVYKSKILRILSVVLPFYALETLLISKD